MFSFVSGTRHGIESTSSLRRYVAIPGGNVKNEDEEGVIPHRPCITVLSKAPFSASKTLPLLDPLCSNVYRPLDLFVVADATTVAFPVCTADGASKILICRGSRPRKGTNTRASRQRREAGGLREFGWNGETLGCDLKCSRQTRVRD